MYENRHYFVYFFAKKEKAAGWQLSLSLPSESVAGLVFSRFFLWSGKQTDFAGESEKMQAFQGQ